MPTHLDYCFSDTTNVVIRPGDGGLHGTTFAPQLERFLLQAKPLLSKRRLRCSQRCKSTASTSFVVLGLNNPEHYLTLALQWRNASAPVPAVGSASAGLSTEALAQAQAGQRATQLQDGRLPPQTSLICTGIGTRLAGHALRLLRRLSQWF